VIFLDAPQSNRPCLQLRLFFYSRVWACRRFTCFNKEGILFLFDGSNQFNILNEQSLPSFLINGTAKYEKEKQNYPTSINGFFPKSVKSRYTSKRNTLIASFPNPHFFVLSCRPRPAEERVS